MNPRAFAAAAALQAAAISTAPPPEEAKHHPIPPDPFEPRKAPRNVVPDYDDGQGRYAGQTPEQRAWNEAIDRKKERKKYR